MLLPILLLGGLAPAPHTSSIDAGTTIQRTTSAVPRADDYKERLAEAGDDPDKLWAVYEWSLEETSRKKYRKRILKKIVKVAPEYRPAREALGHVEFEGQWFETERDRDRHVEKVAEDRGLVKFDGQWVEPGDVRFLEKGWEKDEATGEWFDPVARERLAAGWQRQDLVWIEPDEVSNLEKGLWKCGDKWLDLDAANSWHADYESPWVIPTSRAIVWSTASRAIAMKAAEQAERAYFDMRKVFGFGGEEGDVPFLVLRDQDEYLRFMDGSEEWDLPQVDPIAMSAYSRTAYADLWFDFDAEVYRGMGVTFWDEDDSNADAFGIHDARFAYGLSFVEMIDPARVSLDDVFDEGEAPSQFAAMRAESHSLPRWFRWGAANYASRWFLDNKVQRGGNAYWARAWSADNLESQGGLLPFDLVFEFPANGQNDDTASLILQAGLLVAYLVDGKDPELKKLHLELQRALEKREDTEKIFAAIRKALSAKEEEVRAFMTTTQ